MSKALYRTPSGVELELDTATASRLFGLELVTKVEPKTKTNSSKEGTK